MVQNYGILLLPEFSNFCFANLIEPLRAANDLSEKRVADWHLFSLDGSPVTSTSGLTFPTEHGLQEMQEMGMLDVLFVLASYNYASYISDQFVQQLKQLRHCAKMLAGLDAGAFALARAGLLNGYRATVHWAEFEVFKEQFPKIHLCPDRYVIDRDRITSGGAGTSMDLMLDLIRRSHGEGLAIKVSEFLLLDTERPASHKQRELSGSSLNTRAPRLVRAIQTMKANIESPLSIGDIAKRIGTSQRQLEREFRALLNTTAARYYAEVRTEAARLLLRETKFSITQVALRCGFSSSATLNRSYKQLYHKTPTAERKHYQKCQ